VTFITGSGFAQSDPSDTVNSRAHEAELASTSGDRGKHGNYAEQPPFTGVELWSKILALLNERDGSVRKERFEQVFGVQFRIYYQDKDSTMYELKAGKDWYFDGGINFTYNNQNKFLGPLGGHSEMVINWGPKIRGDVKQACVTAERVRDDLIANGWTSPWQGWGHWEEVAEQTAKNLQEHAPPGGYMYPPLMPPPIASFWRRGADDSDQRDRLPQGEVFTTGDFAESCVTGIRMNASL
jgi:hypothetical protein